MHGQAGVELPANNHLCDAQTLLRFFMRHTEHIRMPGACPIQHGFYGQAEGLSRSFISAGTWLVLGLIPQSADLTSPDPFFDGG